jgi:hypothetical protein
MHHSWCFQPLAESSHPFKLGQLAIAAGKTRLWGRGVVAVCLGPGLLRLRKLGEVLWFLSIVWRHISAIENCHS